MMSYAHVHHNELATSLLWRGIGRVAIKVQSISMQSVAYLVITLVATKSTGIFLVTEAPLFYSEPGKAI
jgi:hypothetical protein